MPLKDISAEIEFSHPGHVLSGLSTLQIILTMYELL